MWESVQEDALFLLWNILSSLIPKQELCLFLLFLSVVWRRRCSGGGWRLLGPPCRSGGCSRSDMATRRSAYSKLFSHNANKTHCKQTLLERAGGTDRGRVHARVISHLRAGDLSPVSLCRRDKEGLPPRFASQAHVLFLRRKEQSPTLKSQRAKNRHKCMNGLLVQPSERTNPPVADTKKGAGEDSEAAWKQWSRKTWTKASVSSGRDGIFCWSPSEAELQVQPGRAQEMSQCVCFFEISLWLLLIGCSPPVNELTVSRLVLYLWSFFLLSHAAHDTSTPDKTRDHTFFDLFD